MDPNEEIQYDVMPMFRTYKSGRIERFLVSETTTASLDSTTQVLSEDYPILQETDLSARLYRPKPVKSSPEKKLPVLVYYHGGGFCFGSASMPMLHTYLNSLVSKANVLVVSVNYRLAPEYPVPIVYDDSWLALQWVILDRSHEWITDYADLNRLYVGGDSAGANIAHHMAMRVGTLNFRIKGLVLIHPYFLGVETTESDDFDVQMSSGLRRLWKVVCPLTSGFDDCRINPMGDDAPSLSLLGSDKILVCVGGRDVLRDSGRAYYERLKECGWKEGAELFEASKGGHVFHLYDPTCEQASVQDEKICSFLNQ